jgi:hypothetical protein
MFIFFAKWLLLGFVHILFFIILMSLDSFRDNGMHVTLRLSMIKCMYFTIDKDAEIGVDRLSMEKCMYFIIDNLNVTCIPLSLKLSIIDYKINNL